MNKKTILCPTDFTSVANNALSYAIEFSRKMDAELVILHTINNAFVSKSKIEREVDPAPSGLEKIILQKMECLREEIEGKYPALNTQIIVEHGRLETVIPELVNKKNIDLIVIGYLGETGINTNFGDIGMKKLMENISIPILIIPIEYSNSPLNHWLYTSDLTNNDEDKLLRLLEYTLPLDARLELLYVRQNKKKKMEDLEKFTGLLKKFSDQRIIFTEIENEDILEGIEEYAWNNKPDLLIVAKQDKNQLEKLFKKDKVGELVNHMDLPVLVLHEPQI